MKISLIAYTPDPDRLCAQAALVSKWPKGWSEFKDQWNDKTDMHHLTDAVEKGHVSVIEHASFTFSIEGISRACSHQALRHRLASCTMLSQRFSETNSEAYVVPPSIKGNSFAEETFHFYMAQQYGAYRDLLDEGIPKEDARFLLPNATKTNIILTMNARELLHVFSLRCCNRAQWEINEMAWEMLTLVKKVAPLIFSKAGPSCVQFGFCPEGDLSCGRIMEMKEKASNLEVK